MNRFKTLILSGMVVALLLVAIPAEAQAGGGRRPIRRGIGKVFKALVLPFRLLRRGGCGCG